MLKISILMHKVKINYIVALQVGAVKKCSNSGGTKDKGKTG